MDETSVKDNNQQPVPAVGTPRPEFGEVRARIESETPVIPESVKEHVSVSEPQIPNVPDVELIPSGPDTPVNPNPKLEIMTPEEAGEVVKEGPGKDLDLGKTWEGVGFVNSRFALAVLRVKEYLKSLKGKLIRQGV